MKGSASKRRPWGCLIATLLWVFLVPVAVVVAAYVDHHLSFDGVCGPYATDIDAYPCSREQYNDNFWGGFSGLGLMILAVFSMAVAFLVALTAWLCRWAVPLAIERYRAYRSERT